MKDDDSGLSAWQAPSEEQAEAIVEGAIECDALSDLGNPVDHDIKDDQDSPWGIIDVCRSAA